MDLTAYDALAAEEKAAIDWKISNEHAALAAKGGFDGLGSFGSFVAMVTGNSEQRKAELASDPEALRTALAEYREYLKNPPKENLKNRGIGW